MGEFENYRLPPDRQLRFYIRIVRVGLDHPYENGGAGIGIALAAIRNVQDAIARLQEHHVRR